MSGAKEVVINEQSSLNQQQRNKLKSKCEATPQIYIIKAAMKRKKRKKTRHKYCVLRSIQNDLLWGREKLSDQL